ncbi:hypothetical protein BDW59DRAFT_149593 [Aspergillus cavernicola]|uniref:Zn(2)-C6 fungal-type domain-containing protein n=1 Tax=Aspergillus cavernicola TaxID=176166 RepID=A0ABR4I3P7_9EURO
MLPRIAHTKSRFGCDQCRRRRVKCDEQGPPCTNCVLRQLNKNCAYSRVRPASFLANARRTSDAVDELELMHQFTAATYESLCVSESETPTWQVRVPRLALTHRYLMHGILALASLHIATTREPSKARAYIDAGLEYHSMSLKPFRIAVGSLTPENCDAAFAQSVVTTAISLALPQLTATRENSARMTETVLTVFELLQGVKKILAIGKSWINLELFSQGEFWKKNSVAILDAETDAALNSLATLNDTLNLAESHINKDVINHLRYCFMKFSCSSDPAPVLAWLGAVDKGFVDNLRRQEPFSLLVLAHWGILLSKLDGQRWWARNSGRALVSELMDALTVEDILWESCLGWVQRTMSSDLGMNGSQSVIRGNSDLLNIEGLGMSVSAIDST